MSFSFALLDKELDENSPLDFIKNKMKPTAVQFKSFFKKDEWKQNP